jgi:hypothetical protein
VKGNLKSDLKLANTSFSVQYDAQKQEVQSLAVQLHHLDVNHAFSNPSRSDMVGICHQLGHGHRLATFVLVVSHHKLSFFGFAQS